jgi:hypothetical protein
VFARVEGPLSEAGARGDIMKISNSDVLSEHIEELRLAYLEDLLPPDERSKFEEHLKLCPDCAKQTEDMSSWIALVKTNKDALCPEEWELFECARGEKVISGVLASHMEHCPSCRASAEAFRKLAPKEGVSDVLWERMTRLDERPAQEMTGVRFAWIYRLWEKLADLFSPPLALAGAVAAAILVVVLLYPSDQSGRLLGLSSVTWAPGLSNLMGGPEAAPTGVTPKDRLAIIVYFKDFRRKPDSERIDSLYRLLDPGREVRLHYDVVSPSEVKRAVESSGMKKAGKDEVLRVLRDKLSVSGVLVMELSDEGDRFRIRTWLMDTATGTVVREREISDVREANLSEEIESASESVLKSR